jgi:predicted RNA-binding protein YlqC (UPF0109 family)
MKNLLAYIVTNLVKNPNKVIIEEETSSSGMIIFNLSVAPEDMGRIIGRQGKIIKAIRNVLRIKAIKENLHFTLNLKEISSQP